MSDEIQTQRSEQRNQYQRHNYDRQNDVRDQDSEIDRADNPLSQEARVTVVIVIGQIGNKEKR